MRVKTTDANLKHCRCPVCPVQENSECSKTILKSGDQVIKKMAKIYCAVGKSVCKDLEGAKSCFCPTCLVWDENNLNSTFYCFNGGDGESQNDKDA